MDPISLMSMSFGLLGVGAQVFGLGGEAATAQKISDTETDMLGTQEQENEVRRQAMVLSNQRMQLENSRNAQAQRSRNEAAGVAQGAQYGSGLAGGQAGVSDTAAQQSRNLSQGFQEANTMFSLSNQEDSEKMRLAQLQGTMSNYQGIAGLGSGLAGASGGLGSLFGTGYNNLFGGSGISFNSQGQGNFIG